jgi:hypothetical protein
MRRNATATYTANALCAALLVAAALRSAYGSQHATATAAGLPAPLAALLAAWQAVTLATPCSITNTVLAPLALAAGLPALAVLAVAIPGALEVVACNAVCKALAARRAV